MKMRLSFQLGVLVILLLRVAADATAQATEIETRHFGFNITYVLDSAKIRHKRVYSGRCEVQSVGPSAFGLDGPTSQQRAADTQAREKAVSPGNAMAEQMKKCGSDMNCAMKAMQSAQASGDLEKLGRGVQAASAQGANFTNWTATTKSCSALTLTVDDQFERTLTDDGEGGNRSYVIQYTVKGSKPVEGKFGSDKLFGIQHNLKTQQTEYRFGRPRWPAFPTTRRGDAPDYLVGTGDTTVDPFPPSVKFPIMAGAPKSGKSTATVPGGGTVTFEWTLTK
jgi:hypothetical protein